MSIRLYVHPYIPVISGKAREFTASEASRVLGAKWESAIRAKRGYILPAKRVEYYEQSEQFDQTSAARKCIVRKISSVIFWAKQGGYYKLYIRLT